MSKPKLITSTKAQGKTICRVYDTDNHYASYRVRVRIPGKSKLPNFDLKTRDHDLIVLYEVSGDTILPSDLRSHLFDDGRKGRPTPIAIDRKSGEVFQVSYAIEKGALSMFLWRVPSRSSEKHTLRIPKPYRRRLDELKCLKRPFAFTLVEHQFIAFLSHWTGYKDLYQDVTLRLNFEPRAVEIHGDDFREVSSWGSSQG